VWRVNFCSGLVMMAQAGKLDYEGIDAPTHYDLLVYLYDDHRDTKPYSDPLFNTTAVWTTVRIEAIDGNDPPTWPKQRPTIYIDENIGDSSAASDLGLTIADSMKKMDPPHILDVDIEDTHVWTFNSVKESLLGTGEECPVDPLNPFDASSAFSLHNETGQLRSGELSTDYECGIRFDISITVTDQGTDTNGVVGALIPAGLSETGFISVSVLDLNDPPSFYLWEKTDTKENSPSFYMPAECSKGTLCRTVPENSVAEITTVPAKLTSTDVDAGGEAANAITYEKVDDSTATGSDKFTVDSDGTIRVLSAALLNFESQTNSYTVKVKATDSGMIGRRECKKTPELSQAKKDFCRNVPKVDRMTADQKGWGSPVQTAEIVEIKCKATQGKFNFSTTGGWIWINAVDKVDDVLTRLDAAETFGGAITSSSGSSSICGASEVVTKIEFGEWVGTMGDPIIVLDSMASTDTVESSISTQGVAYYQHCQDCDNSGAEGSCTCGGKCSKNGANIWNIDETDCNTSGAIWTDMAVVGWKWTDVEDQNARNDCEQYLEGT